MAVVVPEKRERSCGSPKCAVSSGIHEGLTFGSGELDEWGYWEKPCATCARAFEKKHPEQKCWPFEYDAFQSHSNACKHCFENPLDICPVGQKLLGESAAQAGLSITAYLARQA